MARQETIRRWRGSGVAWLTCLALALFAFGCRHRSDSVKVDDTETTQWVWVAEVYASDEDDTFSWNSTLSDVVRVEFKADDFTGDARVRIYDGSGVEIFDEEYSGYSSHFRVNDFSAPAIAGLWSIRLELFDATGDLRVIVLAP